jgi:hypothetical protein
MFIGHLGAGLAMRKFDKKTNLAWFFISVLFLDLLLWIFILLGFEKVIVPRDFENLHYLKFIFPYSHSLIATVAWSILVYVVTEIITKRRITAVLLGLGVFSHYIFDLIVHTPELSILGDNSYLIGLGLWNHIYLALTLELLLYFTGLFIYMSETRGVGFGGKYGMYIFSVLLVAAAFISQVLSPRPHNGNEVAGSALLSIVLVILISYWLDKKRISSYLSGGEISDGITAS